MTGEKLYEAIGEISDNKIKEAKQFNSTITLECGGKKAAAKGLMGVMGLAVKKGNEVTITAEGDDEDAAISALETFFKANL